MSPNYDPLIESGQMELIDGDREIVPGVSVRVFRGHTAYMQAVIVSGGEGSREKDGLLYLGFDSDELASGFDLGHGVRFVSAGHD